MVAITPYRVQFILTQAIYKAGLQDVQFFAPLQGSYQEVALNDLTGLLDEWRDKVPFAQQVTYDNVTELAATPYTSVANVNYILPPNVQVALESVGKDEFYRRQTIIGLNSIPAIYWFDELSQTINVYPVPTQPSYQFVVWGRQQMVVVLPTDVLPSNIPRFMADALIYELAYRLAALYGVPWSPEKDAIRMKLVNMLENKKDIDLRAPVSSVFGRPGAQIPPYPYLYWMIAGSNG